MPTSGSGIAVKTLGDVLRKNRSSFGPIVPVDFSVERLYVFDFSAKNKELMAINLAHTEEFDRYIVKTLRSAGATVGIGGYNEDRTIYRHSSLFVTPEGESRTVHLGIDIFLPVGTKVHAPIEGTLHSYNNNKGMGDNGPTLVLEHHLEGMGFYTLYSHLSEETLVGKVEGMPIKKGEVIGETGNMQVNGNWPPHLHFQIIKDMLGKKGDYPGVASLSMRDQYLQLCPDPGLILDLPVDRPKRPR